jgi:hypothetical protein
LYLGKETGDMNYETGPSNLTNPGNTIWSSALSKLKLSGSDGQDSINIQPDRFGNMTAVFETTPTVYELSSQTLNQLYLLVAAPIIAYLIPRVASWINILRQRKYFNRYFNTILNYSESKVGEQDVKKKMDDLKTVILKSYSKDQLSESHYKILIDKVNEYSTSSSSNGLE